MPETAAAREIITVAVIDDDANVRQGLWWLLNNVIGIRCTGAYASCQEFLANSEQAPDVLLLDIAMPGVSGFDAIPMIKAKYPALKIIMHSNFDDDDKIMRARQAKVCGYILKNASAPQLYEAIEQVYRGNSVWPAGFEQDEPDFNNSMPRVFLKALKRRLGALAEGKRKPD